MNVMFPLKNDAEIRPAGVVALAAALACQPALAGPAQPWPTALLAAPGYMAAINTPKADVLPWGAASLALTNSNPEGDRDIPVGSFGSLNAGLGLLPGLELAGRLSYQGDLGCNQFLPDCWSRSRDLSVSGKYRLPVQLPFDTRVALGFTDYGGAATNYRQVYGVATSTWGPLDLSLGYGKPKSSAALLQGGFGSAVLRLNEHWSAALEHDTHAPRLGVQYHRPLTPDLALQLGASRRLGDTPGQQPWQISAQLNWVLGRPAGAPLALTPSVAPLGASPVSPLPQPEPLRQPAAEPVPDVALALPPQPLPPASAESLLRELRAAGFAQVGVRLLPASGDRPALWQVRAEPLRWRQSQLDALGAALAAWRKLHKSDSGDELALSLTYQRQPVLGVHTSAACLAAWVEGWGRCELSVAGAQTDADAVTAAQGGGALRLYRLVDWPAPLRARLALLDGQPELADDTLAWVPRFEIGPGLRNTVGTEYGLFDYSLSLELGFEAGLAPGLSLQGVASAPVARSDDFAPGKVFGAQDHPGTGLDSAFLSYWRPLPAGLAVQGAVGRLSRHESGGQLDATWMSADGRWRLAGLGGRYSSDLDQAVREPLLAALRYSVAPGAWHLDAMAGRFINGDEGYKLMSSHWMGDARFSFYYRNSGSPQSRVMPDRSFLGFEFSLPLGPRAAQQWGPVAVRARDRWGWGVETKVGESNNKLTAGYGLIPRLRHGLTSDVSDHDRNGQQDLQAQLPRLRAILQQP